jgi:hypothetical protein
VAAFTPGFRPRGFIAPAAYGAWFAKSQRAVMRWQVALMWSGR